MPLSLLWPTPRAGRFLRLANGEATVNELAEPSEMTQPAISRHLKVLEEAGLIVRRVEGTSALADSQKRGLKRWTSGSQCCEKPLRQTTTGWTKF
jgi:DNA-binding transcriptional ArsR family regulator